MEQTPPGWYPHPEGGLRWWNGQQWANPPSVTPPATAAAKAEEPPEAQLAQPAWTLTTAPPQQEGAPPLPKGRGRGRTIALVIGGVVAASFIATEVEAFREDAAPALEPVAAVTGPANGCDRFLALLHGMIRDKADDVEGDRRIAQLRDAARESDVLLASDLQDMLDADSAADVSVAGQIILRRCVAAGHASQAEVQGLATAGLNTFAAPAAPSRPAAPPPALAEESEPAPVEEEEEPPYEIDELSAGQPTCAQVLPILRKHPNDMREWLTHFDGGVAGTPWKPGEYVTLYSLSPDTGDPIRQTLTVANSLLDDYDLNDEAFGDDVPNRVLIFFEDGIKCADGP